jgi:hypothetical protein
MRKLILAGVLFASACGGTQTATAPTVIERASTTSVTADSSVMAQPTTSFTFCPTAPPFSAQVGIVVSAADLNLVVSTIRFRFVDSNGVQMPPVTLPAPVMATQFGSALVAARSSRTFPLDVHFGCGTLRTGTILVTVDTTDANGRTAVQDLSIGVR